MPFLFLLPQQLQTQYSFVDPQLSLSLSFKYIAVILSQVWLLWTSDVFKVNSYEKNLLAPAAS